MKKLFISALLLLTLCLGLFACKGKELVVTFDTDGGSNVASVTVEKGEKIVLPTAPTKEGYTFIDWYCDEKLTEKFSSEKEIKEEITLFAKWEIKKYKVTFIHGDNVEYEATVEHGKAATAPTPDAVEGKFFTQWDTDFSKVTSDLVVKAKYSDATYVYTFKSGINVVKEITIGSGDALTEIPEVPAVEGKIGYWDRNDFFEAKENLTFNAKYVDEKDIEIAKEYELSVVERLDKENGILRWVFFAGEEYPYANFQKQVIGSESVAKIVDGKLVAVGVGTFYVKMSTATDSAVYVGIVMPNVYSFKLGDNMNFYLGTTADLKNSSYLNKTATPYQVGTKNYFALDLDITDNKFNNLDNVDLVYKVKLTDKDNKITEHELSEVALIADGKVTFKADYIGYKVTLEVSPKYAPIRNLEKPSEYKAIVTFELNDGVNVYSDADLKLAYCDLEVTQINLHASFEAQLNPEQLNPNGTPKNYYDPIAYKDNGNVYCRVGEGVKDNHLVVNGNYFIINGSKLPVMKVAEEGPEYEGQGGRVTVGGIVDDDYTICSVQTGIFMNKIVDVTDELVTEEVEHKNSVTYNNLTVLGNTKTPETNFGQLTQAEIEAQIAATSENSGGYDGIVARECELYTNNVIVGYTTLGLFGVRKSANVYCDYTYIYSSWGNCLYGWGAHIFDVKNSLFKNSGGVAIQMDDCYKQLASEQPFYDPRFIMDEKTVVENFVLGTEPWFQAYGLSAMAPTIKGDLESGFSALTQGSLSILKEFVNSDGTNKSEMVNLVFFSRANSDAIVSGEDSLKYGAQISMNISGLETSRPFTFLKDDPRALALKGQYLGLCGYDVDGQIFSQTVAYLMQGGKSQAEAVMTALGKSYVDNGIGKGYLEVVTQMPGLGSVTMVTTIQVNA